MQRFFPKFPFDKFNTCVPFVSLLALALLLPGCGVGGSGASFGGKTASQTASGASTGPAAVQVAAVERGSLTSNVSYSGNIQARQQVSLVPKVSGRVTRINVDVGSAVKAGDALLELERDSLEAQVAQAEGGMATAQGGLAAAQAKLDGIQAGPRAEQVAQAESNLQIAQSKLAQLKAGPTKEQLDAAEAQVRLAKNQLYLAQAAGDAQLGKPFSSYTKEQKDAQSGIGWEQVQVAQANLDALKAGPTAEQLAQAAAAVDLAQQQLALAKAPFTEFDVQAATAAVDQAKAGVAQAKAAVDLARLNLAEATVRAPFDGVISQRLVSEGASVGPTAPVLALISAETEVIVNVDERSVGALSPGQEASISASAYPGQEFAATITSVAPTVDAKSRTALVRLAPDDSDGKLRDGMFAQVRLAVAATSQAALLVPKGAVVQEAGDTVVYSVADGRVKRNLVTTGATDGERIEVVAGLAEGQKIAISGLSGLRDGAEVTVQ